MEIPTTEETFLRRYPGTDQNSQMLLIIQLEHPQEQSIIGPCLALLNLERSGSTRSMDSG